jgi:hypothetical protein
MGRYENLQRLREAKRNRQGLSREEIKAAVERAIERSSLVSVTPAPVTKTVTETPTAAKNKGGRPRLPHPLSNAERQARWRKRHKK